MEQEDFNKWLVSDLKTLLLQYDIEDSDIKGSGKNGNVLKKDYIQAISKINFNPLKSNQINKDIWYNILLQLDYKDLKNTCLTDKNAVHVCNNKAFWENKFKYDGLILIGKVPQTLEEWRKKYKYASMVTNKTNKIVNLVKLNYNVETYIDLNFDMAKIIPEYQNDIKKARNRFVGDFLTGQGFEIKNKNGIVFKFFYLNEIGDEPGKFKKNISDDELFMILYRYLHYFQPKDLLDDQGFTYDINDLRKTLKKLIEKKTPGSYKVLEQKIKLLS